MSNSSGKSNRPTWSAAIVAILGLLAFLGYATIDEIIPRQWIPEFLQPRSWRDDALYSEVDRSQLPLLFAEDFEGEDATSDYLRVGPVNEENRVDIRNGRLVFEFNKARSGEAVKLPGVYEQFSLAFSVYPIGEMFDESVNILFHKSESDWYEIWLRPRRGEIVAFRVEELLNDGVIASMHTALNVTALDEGAISLGPLATRIQLDVDEGEFTLFVNGKQAAILRDIEPPILTGNVELGGGAGAAAGVGMEIDDIEIRGR